MQRLGELVSEKMLPGRPLAAITHHEHGHPETPEIQWITVPYSNYSNDIIFTSIHMYMYVHIYIYICMYVRTIYVNVNVYVTCICYIYEYVYVNVSVHVYVFVHVHVHKHICII